MIELRRVRNASRVSLRRASVAVASCLVAAACLSSCAGKTSAARGGLMLIISAEGDLPVDRLDVEVRSKGETQLTNQYRVPAEAQLPTTVAIVSNGDPTAQAQIAITAWHSLPGAADAPLDRRDAIVTQVPTDRVATLRVVLSAACTRKVKLIGTSAQSTCQEGETCDGTGACISGTVVATSLPLYHPGDENRTGDSAGGSSGQGGTGGAAGASAGGRGGTSGAGGPSCGDGRLQGSEKCDDGNPKSADGCDANCAVETGWVCDQAAPSVCTAVCGDGLLVGDEAAAGGCDDSNLAASDGCNASCHVEAGYVCSGAPSKCAKTCGNSLLDPGEKCDDGNNAAGDGCQSCAIEAGYACDNSKLPSKCTDVDECAVVTPPCAANAKCTNTAGSYSCACLAGYSGDGKTCTIIDQCASTTPPCDVNATCKSTSGSYTCTCIGGYTGSGKTCIDACVSPCKRGTITEFPVPTSMANVQYIAAGADGNLWFTESGAGKVGRITPNGVFSEFAFPQSNGAGAIVAGPDGNIWLAEGGKVARVTPAGVITEFTGSGFAPQGSGTVGPDGNLWFTNSSNNPPKIAKVTVAGVISPFTLASTATFPFGITSGPGGNLWFTEAGGNKVGVLTTSGAVLNEYPIPTSNAFASSITVGSDGNLWIAEQGNLPTSGNKIGRMTPTGVITEFDVPTPNASPSWINAHSDGTLWFTEVFANKIGRITTNGAFLEFPIPTPSSSPIAIASGADGNLWFTEAAGNKIGRIVP